MLAYKPDETIDTPTSLAIGGTRLELAPTQGGETGDAMLIHLPQEGVLFVGDILMDYLNVGEAQIARAVERMMADGRHELAAETLRWAQARLPASHRLAAAHRQAYLKLMEQYQAYNPFKFIVYAAQAAEPVPPIPEVAKAQR